MAHGEGTPPEGATFPVSTEAFTGPGDMPEASVWGRPAREGGAVLVDTGLVLDRRRVHEILTDIAGPRAEFSKGAAGVREAVEAIMRLQRHPRSVSEAALAVPCPYCGEPPGKMCSRAGEDTATPHPSRLSALFEED